MEKESLGNFIAIFLVEKCILVQEIRNIPEPTTLGEILIQELEEILE